MALRSYRMAGTIEGHISGDVNGGNNQTTAEEFQTAVESNRAISGVKVTHFTTLHINRRVSTHVKPVKFLGGGFRNYSGTNISHQNIFSWVDNNLKNMITR